MDQRISNPCQKAGATFFHGIVACSQSCFSRSAARELYIFFESNLRPLSIQYSSIAPFQSSKFFSVGLFYYSLRPEGIPKFSQ